MSKLKRNLFFCLLPSLFFLLSPASFAKGVIGNPVAGGPGADEEGSTIFFGIAPVYSQMSIRSTSTGTFNSWGFSAQFGYNRDLFGPLGLQGSIDYVKLSGSNTQNTLINREDLSSANYSVFLGITLFDKIAIGPGYQLRGISLSQNLNGSVLEKSYYGSMPFAKASYDWKRAGFPYSLSLAAEYFNGKLDTIFITDIEVLLSVKYTLPLK